MKCTFCGEEIQDDARFCGFCGAEQAEATAEAMPVIEENVIPEVEAVPEIMTLELPMDVEEEPITEIPELEVDIAPQLEEVSVSEPEMEEIPELEVTPEPEPEPVVEPVVEVAPVVEPEPEPEPVVIPPVAVAPVSQPEPAPVVIPPVVPASQPMQQPVVAPAPQPVQQPVVAPAPQPVYQAPQPVYQAPQPVYQTPPQPVYQAPQPVYQAPPQPVYQAPQPVYQAPPQPQYQPQPVYQAPPQPQYQPQPVYQPAPQPQYQPRPAQQPMVQRPVQQRPAYQLPTGRGLIKLWLLTIITLGIYPMVMWSRMSVEINMVASRYDGKRTMHFLWMPVVGALTLGIYMFVWLHQLCNRIGNELKRRQVNYKFSAATFWLWTFVYGIVGGVVTGVVGFLLTSLDIDPMISYAITAVLGLASSVGSAVFGHKILKAFNLMNADYNEKG